VLLAVPFKRIWAAPLVVGDVSDYCGASGDFELGTDGLTPRGRLNAVADEPHVVRLDRTRHALTPARISSD
jgi:hypothetical protein